MLTRHRSVRQLQIHFITLILIADVCSLLATPNEKHRACNVLLPSRTSQHSVTQFRKIAHMDRNRHILPNFFCLALLNLLKSLLPNDLLFPFDQLQYFPANFLQIFIITLEIRADIGNNLGGLVLLNESNKSKNVQNLRNKVLQIEILLLVHKRLHNLFNTTLSHHILLVNQTVKYTRQQLTAQHLRTQRSRLTKYHRLLVKHLTLRWLTALKLLQLTHHTPKTNVYHVLWRYTQNQTQSLEVEYYIQRFSLILEDLYPLVD